MAITDVFLPLNPGNQEAALLGSRRIHVLGLHRPRLSLRPGAGMKCRLSAAHVSRQHAMSVALPS